MASVLRPATLHRVGSPILTHFSQSASSSPRGSFAIRDPSFEVLCNSSSDIIKGCHPNLICRHLQHAWQLYGIANDHSFFSLLCGFCFCFGGWHCCRRDDYAPFRSTPRHPGHAVHHEMALGCASGHTVDTLIRIGYLVFFSSPATSHSLPIRLRTCLKKLKGAHFFNTSLEHDD